jgi:hypothetical protein
MNQLDHWNNVKLLKNHSRLHHRILFPLMIVFFFFLRKTKKKFGKAFISFPVVVLCRFHGTQYSSGRLNALPSHVRTSTTPNLKNWIPRIEIGENFFYFVNQLVSIFMDCTQHKIWVDISSTLLESDFPSSFDYYFPVGLLQHAQ